MGTGPFAVPMFRAILASPHRVLALVTRPDRPAHRRERAPVNPMRDAARENDLEVFEPESINSPEAGAWLREKSAHLFVVCDYGQILSRQTLALVRLGGINLHASLLPKYRGAAPINWAIYYGESETGVTVIHMTPQLDAGPGLVQRRTPISPAETAPELETRLAELGAGAVLEAIEILARGENDAGIPQDPKLASKAPRLKKEDGLVDWSRSAVEIFNQIRALEPWPRTFTFVTTTGGQRLQVSLEKVTPLKVNHLLPIPQALARKNETQSGTVVDVAKDKLIVKCGSGALAIDALKPAGKRAMTIAQFLCGHALHSCDKLG
jgi:methionyl-tRNA formyltransferase